MWENQHLSWIMYTWASKTMPNKQTYSGQSQNHIWIANFRGGAEKLPFPQKLRFFHGLMTWLVMQKNVSAPCVDDHQFKEEMKSVGKLSQMCSQIVLKCVCLARIGRPDVLWSMNKLARSITKRTKACDKRMNRLISHIHHTCEYKQHCHVGNTAKQCRLGLFQDSDFAGRSWGLKIHFGRNIVHFWKSYICSNKLDVQETNYCFSQFNRIRNHLFGHWTEIGWVACSGTVGSNCFWPLETWFRLLKKPGRPAVNNKDQRSQRITNVLNHVVCVPSNVQFSHQKALLLVVEDNEQFVKGRSPTMRHVSRTHRVALDWLFDRIDLDSKIQIKYMDTKNQLADILTKGNFPRDEWIHLLCLFNINPFSFTVCSEVMSQKKKIK